MKPAFTLVEMLVSVILLSLLIGVAVFSFRLQLITIHKTKLNTIQKAIRYTQIHAAIESIKDYVVFDYDNTNRPIPHSLHYFFKGESKSMEFVTSAPIYSQADSVVRFICADDALFYYEEPLYGNIDFLRPHIRKNARAYRLMENIKGCSFEYTDAKGQQLSKFARSLPSAVSIVISKDGGTGILYAKVRNDNNLSKFLIEDRIYDN